MEFNLESPLFEIEKEFKSFLDSDDALFHYTKSNIALEHIIFKMQLCGSMLENFSDPNEDFEPSFPMVTMDKQNQNKNNTEYGLLLKKYKKKMKIYCFCSNTKFLEGIDISLLKSDFSELKDEYIPLFFPVKGYYKHRMWDNYSAKSTGVCLVFSKQTIIKSLFNDSIYDNVNYNKELYFEREKDNSYNFIDGINPKQNVINHLKNKYFKKFYDYQDENEYRILTFTENRKNPGINIENSLKAIIFGVNFNKIYIDLFLNLLKNYPKIVVLQHELSDGIPYHYLYKIK